MDFWESKSFHACGGTPLRGFPPHPFPCARRRMRLAGETPGEGLPAKKMSTGQFFLPVLRFASHYPERACSARSGEIPRLRSRPEAARLWTPASLLKKGLTENFYHLSSEYANIVSNLQRKSAAPKSSGPRLTGAAAYYPVISPLTASTVAATSCPSPLSVTNVTV